MILATTRLGAKRRKKNVQHVSTLDLEDIYIVLFNFMLTKSFYLRKSTIEIINENFKATCQRKTRSTTHNLGNMGLHFDENNE